jgi:hypothetical protein
LLDELPCRTQEHAYVGGGATFSCLSAERKFNEGAAQVKRLLNRDRSSVPDLDKPAAFDTDGVVTDDEARTSSENGSQQPVEKTRGAPLSGALMGRW